MSADRIRRIPRWMVPTLAVALGVTLAVTVLSCRREKAPDELAAFRGGSISIGEVETRLRAQNSDSEAVEGVDWSRQYREAAETLAVERWLLRDLEGLDTREFDPILQEELGSQYARLRCEAALDVGFDALEIEPKQPSRDEMRNYYDEHRDLFERPEQRLGWHLFLRREPEQSQEDLLGQLAELKARIEDGQSFRQMAKVHSDSENRSLGGHLGWIVPGRLPPDLEEVVFALPAGGTSRPLATDGGGLLIYVSDVLPGVSLAFDDARALIARRIADVALLERLEDLAEDVDLDRLESGETLILEEEELLDRFRAATAGGVLLRVGDVGLRTSDLREQMEARQARGFDLLTPEQHLLETYRFAAARIRLCSRTLAEGFEDEPKAERFRQIVGRLGTSALLDVRLDDQMGRRLDEKPDELRRFFEDNRHLFTSSLALRVDGLTLDPGPDPAGSMDRLQRVRSELVEGRVDLDRAASDLVAERIEPRWVGPQELATMEPKVRAYLSQLGGTGFTIPFQNDGKLHVLRVAERREPTPLPWDVVEEHVREAYFQRHQQAVFSELKSDLLREARFEFHDDLLERHLARLGLGGAESRE